MKRFLWGTWLACALAACPGRGEDASPISATTPDATSMPDGGPDTKALLDARPDAEKRQDVAPPDSSFVAPAPTLNAMAPMKAIAGGLGLSLVLTGDHFVSWSVVRADGADLPTTYVSETELHALLPAARIDDAGVLQIDVFTTTPGGGKSTTLGFLVENPLPILTAITPSSVEVNSSGLPITLMGGSFAKTVKVSFDGTDLALGTITATSIAATIPATLLHVSGSHAVIVSNPAPAGGKSSPIAFTVTNPQVVSVSAVTPNHATVGSGDVTVKVEGSGFVAASYVSFNGINVSSTMTDQSQISATIPAALLATSGSFPIAVNNPAPGGGVSNPVQFEAWNAVPTLTSLSPNTVYYGGADRKVAVLGTNFVPTTSVLVDGSWVTTIYVSPNSLEAIIPAAMLASLGTRSITVHNGSPGGGDSAASTLFVVCDPTGVDVALGPAGNITTLFTDFSTAASVAPIRAGKCPTTMSSTTTPTPARAWVVQNNQSLALTLSTWAVCSTDAIAEDDAFMTIYKRPTAPANDAERLQCTGVVSEGANGTAGDYRSPESNGSNWCPGLTKANGGGIGLAACERAVVWTMPYSMKSAYYTPPVTIRLKAE